MKTTKGRKTADYKKLYVWPRREKVGQLVAQMLTNPEIVEALTGMGFLNPDGDPWDDSTISRDRTYISKQLEKEILKNALHHQTNLIGVILEVRRKFFVDNDMKGVLSTVQPHAKLTGANAPEQYQEVIEDGLGKLLDIAKDALSPENFDKLLEALQNDSESSS